MKKLNLGSLYSGKSEPNMDAISAPEENPISVETSAEASIQQPKQIQKTLPKSTASGEQEQTANPASSSTSPAADADPSKTADKAPGVSENLLKLFGPAKTSQTHDLMETLDAKDSFLQADFILPGIALKKVKQAMNSENATPQNYIAALGQDEVKMYRAKRNSVTKMVLADIMEYRETFWQRVGSHLHGQKIAAFLMASHNPLSTEDVSWLT